MDAKKKSLSEPANEFMSDDDKDNLDPPKAFSIILIAMVFCGITMALISGYFAFYR